MEEFPVELRHFAAFIENTATTTSASKSDAYQVATGLLEIRCTALRSVGIEDQARSKLVKEDGGQTRFGGTPEVASGGTTLNKKELIRLGGKGEGLLLGDSKKPLPILKPGWVMLVVDTSQSMSSFPFGINPHLMNVKTSGSVVVDGQTLSVADLPPDQHLTGKTALDAAKVEAIEFANKARAQRYLTGLVSFDDQAKVIRFPADKIPFTESVAALKVGGSTNMAAGVFVAYTTLQQAPGEKAMVIISDGLPDDEEKTINAAKSAKSFGVRIITIGVPGANEAFLKKIASAHDLATLTEFENLGDAMDKAVKLLPAPRPITGKGQ